MKLTSIFTVLLLIAIMSVLFGLSIGQYNISYQQIINAVYDCLMSENSCSDSDVAQQILWQLRLPRILIAFITGAGLAITGVVLQTLTRNPLADPYLFGISSGASLGAVCALAFGAIGLGLSFAAMLGSMLSVILMVVLAGGTGRQVQFLVLAGVAISFMLSSLTSLVLYFSTPNVVAALLFWMMGSFDHIGWQDLASPLVVLIICLGIFMLFARQLDAMLAGDKVARSLGIATNHLRLSLLIVAALLTSVLVSKVGGIGFVGLMVPHICRFFAGHQLRLLLPVAFLSGGIFMVWVDTISRTILTDQQLPIGIVTAAIGSIFFIILLKHYQTKQRQESI